MSLFAALSGVAQVLAPKIMPKVESFLSKIPGPVKAIAPTLAITGAATMLQRKLQAGPTMPTLEMPVMPGVAHPLSRYRPVGGGYGGGRRRGRGFSSRDIRQTRRMMKMLKEFTHIIPKRKAC